MLPESAQLASLGSWALPLSSKLAVQHFHLALDSDMSASSLLFISGDGNRGSFLRKRKGKPSSRNGFMILDDRPKGLVPHLHFIL